MERYTLHKKIVETLSRGDCLARVLSSGLLLKAEVMQLGTIYVLNFCVVPRLQTSGRVADMKQFHASPSPMLSSDPHHLIQTNQWEAERLESTKKFLENGSRLPIVWVGEVGSFVAFAIITSFNLKLATKNGDIPPGAVPFGEDSDGPLYIARALIEV